MIVLGLGSLFMSYVSIMNFTKELSSFTSLLASIVFNDLCGV